MKIEGMCEPDGPGTGYVLCEDAFATRWFVVDDNGRPMGNFDSRDLAEEYAGRRGHFKWGAGDVDHH